MSHPWRDASIFKETIAHASNHLISIIQSNHLKGDNHMITFATDEGIKPETIKTRLTVYGYDIGLARVLKRGSWKQTDYPEKPEDKAAYDALCEERKASGIHLMRVYSMRQAEGDYNLGPSREITLETKHLFGNQWNAAPDEYSSNGFRVHNWYEEIVPNASLRIGHALEITQEMRDLCAATFKCGHCGAEYFGAHNQGRFCSKCLHSEYLKEAELHLLRLMPVDIDESFPKRAPLTPEEHTEMIPVYRERQNTGNDERGRKKRETTRERILRKYEEKVANLTLHAEERDGMLWLWERNISVENVIYYSHVREFAFGWRDALQKDDADRIREILTKEGDTFPFNYELKLGA